MQRCKVDGTTCGDNPQTCRWTTEINGVIKLEEQSYKAWLASCTLEAAGSYQRVKRCTALAVAEAKILMWKEFG